MAAVELQISVILLFALAGYLLASRINQSAVVGIIIIGIIIGPSIFSIVQYSDAVKMLAHLGAIMLLFAIGLEFRIKDVYQIKYMFIALIGVVVPWAAGYFLGNLFGYNFNESMFIGVALTATSIAITASVLQEMKKLNTPAAKAIIGAAVIDDVLGLLALSITIQSTRAENIAVLGILIIAIESIVFLSACIFAAPYIKRIFLRLDEAGFAKKHPHLLFITAIMLCFFYSSAAELLGLSAIVGAFLAGAALEGIRFKNSKDLKDGAEYLHVIFGAIFFISLGILANLRELSPGILPFFIILLLVAVFSKVAGCGIASRLAGFNKTESLVIGFGMSPRGEVAMIAALIGLTSNIIKQDVYVSIVAMSLLTTMLTPFVIRNYIKWDA
ncbi:MAG: cation:proton antiporter [Nitrospirae bacterium CG_4_10_14_3_um_filter_44_29]|nr:cation:proton antiporter [Nitrospirota bacterium]OIO31107.1 MAG: sodium:proton exchanger [Nitrospirae bacterium CG1_02_44_142]PIP71239.1 MAG: sodium:proton exchanger [Nitrospirae bacterium CG22_combo_CG10-13_8_21_14_all_44_11]PIV66830.1 MAG: cation:proton antiporter [Nitrospirae bacterium CG01_land_8_20_14_3_00_44_22]PIW88929.1 MAG: cation:proton antiporter [Nitrospirae bacterium CG_4_8_14_3_um_filter_44_28]PIX89312.1 MAG: cation:proton antiporter [Nitrospirae bacterium CG_4_10_14_3_um_filt